MVLPAMIDRTSVCGARQGRELRRGGVEHLRLDREDKNFGRRSRRGRRIERDAMRGGERCDFGRWRGVDEHYAGRR